MSEQIHHVLRNCRLFRELPHELLWRLVRFGRLVRFRKGQIILRPGQPCPGVYCVGHGMVQVYKVALSGRQHTLQFAGPGMSFAEVATVLARPCPAYAACTEDSVCVLLPADRFRQLLEESHALCLHLLRSLAWRTEYLVGLMEDIALRDSSARVASYLLRAGSGTSAPFELPVLKKDLASHLNLTKEALSRTLRRLQQAGLIEVPGRRRIRILDPYSLNDVAEGLVPQQPA